MIILDTNVVSEPVQPRPSETVLRWFAAHDPKELFTTTITEAEALFGVARMPLGSRRVIIEKAMRALFDRSYQDRVLPFDRIATGTFADIVTTRMRMGLPIGMLDAQIAAIARSRGAAVATRDVKDFLHCGVEIINPWSD